MNYRNADEERIRKQKELQEQNRQKVAQQKNLENKTYSGKSLDALAKGQYSSLRNNTTNKVPELKPSSKYNNQNVVANQPQKSTRDTRYDNDFDNFFNYRYGDFSGEVDYDPVTDTDVESWRNVKKDIMRKNKWSDKEFEDKFKAYSDERYKKMGDEIIASSVETAKKHPFLGTLQQAILNPGVWLEGAANMVSGLPFVPDKYKAQSADDPMFLSSRQKEAIKQTVKDEHIKSNVGKGAYDIGTGLADMVMSAGVPVLGAATLGTETASRNQRQALERGADPNKAALTGLATGVVSGAMNKVGLDKALASNTIRGAMNKEGLENILEDVATLGIDKAINKNKSQLNAMHDYYASQGMDDQSAWTQVMKDTGLDLATSYGTGAAFGGVMSGLNRLPSLLGGRNNTPDIPDNNIPVVTGDATIDNAIKQTADAEAEIQRLSEQIPKVPEVASESAPTLTPEEQAALQTELANEGFDWSEGQNGQFTSEKIDNLKAGMARNMDESVAKANELTEMPKPVRNANESAPKNPTITSKPIDKTKPIKDQLSPEDRASIFGGAIKGKRRQGLKDSIGYAKKFAGDTAEAKKLAKETNALIESYVESGSTDDYITLLKKIEDLDNLARETRADYTTKKGDVFTYDNYFTDFDDDGTEIPSSLLDQFVGNSALSKSVKAVHDALAKTTSAPTDGQLASEDIPETGNEVPNVKSTEPTPPVPPSNNEVPEVKDKVRSFSRRGSEDKSLPKEIRNVLKNDYYKVARNADTEAKANSLFDENNLTQTRSNLEQLLDKKDPASALLSYKLAGAYVDAKEYDAATDVLRQVSEKLTEAGQFTQAAKLAMVRNDPMAALRMYQRDLDNLNQWGKDKYGKKWEKIKLTDEDKAAFKNIKAGDSEALSSLVDTLNGRFSKQIPSTLWDKIVSATKTSMLLNPRTQFRNVGANMAFLPLRSVSDRVSAIGQNITHLINPNVKVTQSLKGGNKVQKDIAGQIFENMRSDILNENKMKDSTKSDILSRRQTFNDDFFATWVNNLTNGGIEKLNKKFGADANKSTMETLQNFTYWLMGDVGDVPFVKKNFVNRLASYMDAQGITNIDDVPDDAIALATQEALKATFKDDNAFTKALQGVKQKTGKFGEVALPFTKTPANLAVRAYDYSPLGIISTLKKAKSGADVSAVIDDLSKNLTGTAMILLGMKLRDKGILSGNYSENKDEAAAQKRQGMLENAFHIGGKYYTYDWAQPAATPLVLGSVISDAMKASDDQNKEAKDIVNATYKGAIKVGNTIINSSPLQSLSDMLGGDSYSDGPAGSIAEEIIEFPQRFIPSVLGAAARVKDPVIRETYSNDGGLTGILKSQLDTAKSKIPELSKTLPASYDTWGQERRRSNSTGEAAFAQYVNPGQFGVDTSIPIDKDIQAIYDKTGNADVFPKYAPRSLDLGNDGTIKLDNKQHSEYQKELGQLSRKFAEGLFANSEFKKLSDDEKAKMLGNAYNFANVMSKEKLFDHVTDSDKKLKEAYKSGGVNGAIKYWIDKGKADELGITYDTYVKKESEQPGSATQYAQDKQKLDAINDKYGTNIQMSTLEKYGADGAEQRAQGTIDAKTYGFVDKEGNANVDAYTKAVDMFGNDQRSLRAYSDFRKQGLKKNAQMIPALMNNNQFTDKQKGQVIMAEHGYKYDDLGNTAKGAYDREGEAGVYYFYLLKNLADTQYGDGNGSVKKAEKAALMNSDNPNVTKLSDDMYYYLGNAKW